MDGGLGNKNEKIFKTLSVEDIRPNPIIDMAIKLETEADREPRVFVKEGCRQIFATYRPLCLTNS